MFIIVQLAELLTSLVHIYILSVEVFARLAANDPLGAVSITLTGSVCVIAFTVVVIVCELVKWRVRLFVRKHERDAQ